MRISSPCSWTHGSVGVAASGRSKGRHDCIPDLTRHKRSHGLDHMDMGKKTSYVDAMRGQGDLADREAERRDAASVQNMRPSQLRIYAESTTSLMKCSSSLSCPWHYLS